MAAKFIVTNKSSYNVELIIPAPHGSYRNGACFVLTASNSFDLLPWAGSVAACKAIAQLKDLEARNIINIEVLDE